jgi:hypothetical protein
MPDRFGGIEVEEAPRDKFGGVAVDEGAELTPAAAALGPEIGASRRIVQRQPSTIAGGPPLVLPGDTRPLTQQAGAALGDIAEVSQAGASEGLKLGAKIAGKVGKEALHTAAAEAFNLIGDPVSAAQERGTPLNVLKAYAPGQFIEELPPGQTPFQRGLAESSKPVRVLGNIAQGTIESVPKMAAVAGAQALGVPMPIGAGLIFGATEEGFDPKAAAVAAALPFIGKYGGELPGLIAKKLGARSTDVINTIKQLGGMGAVAGAVGLSELEAINQLPEDQRLEAMASAIGGMLILGPMGVKMEKPSAAELLGRQLKSNIGRTVLYGGEGAPKVERADRIAPRPAGEAELLSKLAGVEEPIAPEPKLTPEQVADQINATYNGLDEITGHWLFTLKDKPTTIPIDPTWTPEQIKAKVEKSRAGFDTTPEQDAAKAYQSMIDAGMKPEDAQAVVQQSFPNWNPPAPPAAPGAKKPLPEGTRIAIQEVPSDEHPSGVYRTVTFNGPGNSFSFSPESAVEKGAGFELPDVSKLPPGNWTLAEARAKLAELEKPAAPGAEDESWKKILTDRGQAVPAGSRQDVIDQYKRALEVLKKKIDRPENLLGDNRTRLQETLKQYQEAADALEAWKPVRDSFQAPKPPRISPDVPAADYFKALKQYNADWQKWAESIPENEGVIFDEGSHIYQITPNIGGGWRATSWSKADRMATGHEVYKTKIEALKAHRNGQRLEKFPFTPEPTPTPPKVPPGKTNIKRAFMIHPRPDGVRDILDIIQDLGGIRPPGEGAGGEYDGWADAMTGPAKLLARKDSAHSPDTIIRELRDAGYKELASPNELWPEIKRAVAQREELKAGGGGAEAKHDRFWDAVNDPQNKKGLEQINMQSLNVGDKFTIRGEGIKDGELEVINIDPDTMDIQVRGGSELGIQDIPDGADLWIKKGSIKRGGGGGEGQKPPEPAKPAAPDFSLDKPESVEEQKARLAREAAARKQKEAEEAAKAKAAAGLKGNTGDLGQADALDPNKNDLFSPKPGQKPPEAPAAKQPLFKPEEQKRVDEILARLKEKLGGIGTGGALFMVPPEQPKGPRKPKFELDPEYFTLGTELAGHYIMAGMRRFNEFATAMLQALGQKAKGYLLSWYSNARNQLKDIAGELDDEATAQRAYNEMFGVPEAPKPYVYGTGMPRPGIRVARSELIPPSREFIKADRYAARSGFTLDSEQVRGVNLILDWFQKSPDQGSFLLADGPGFGKTAQCLAVADQYRKLGMGNRILIVTQNKQIAEGRFRADAERMGIDPDGFEITTYTSLNKLAKHDWDLVIWDESHNLKNPDAQKSIAAARLNAKHELFATATPMDRPSGAAYFLSKITGEDYLTVAEHLGYTFQSRTDPVTGKIVEVAVPLPGMNWPKIWDRIMAYRDAAVSAGAMIRREYPFYGKVGTQDLSMSLEAKMEHERIVAFYDRKIESSSSPTAKRNYAGQKTLTLSRWSEQQKLQHAVDAAVEHLQKGGQVVIVAETDKEQTFPQPVRGGRHELQPDKWGNLRDVWKVDGAITQLKRMLAEKGITDVADIHDPGKHNIRGEVERFQRGQAKVALATPQSGGTGIDLDDVRGSAPRLMLALSKNFAGDSFEQLVGRVSRKNTKSESEVRFLNLLDSHADARRNDVLGNKIRTLRAIQGGEELDRAGGMAIPTAPGGERTAGFGGTEKIEGVPLDEGEIEERIYGSSGTPLPPGRPPSARPIPPAPTTPDKLAELANQRLPGLNGIRSLLLPSSQSKAHLTAAETLGAKLGEMHHRDEVVGHGLRRYSGRFDRLGANRADLAPADNPGLRFMSDMSQGRPMSREMQEVADYIDRLFEKHLELLEKAGAPLETIRENYFPGMWTRESRLAFNAAMEKAIRDGIIDEKFDVNKSTPEQRAAIKAIVDKFMEDGTASEKDALAYLSRRPMAGKESFRKQKVFEDIMTAAEMGLRPVSYNPIDLVRLKLAEMSRSIMAHSYYKELKRRGEMKVINPYQQVPEGWEKVNDKYGTIFGPPTVTLPEYVDRALYDGMLEVAKGIGVKHERVLKAGRGALGWASTSGKMVSQFATELSVLAHELGHQLDFKYGLWDRIVAGATAPGARGTPTKGASQTKRGTIKRELRALADLSWEGYDNVSDYYKQKVRKKAEQMAHMLEAYIHAKERFQEVAPTVFKDFDTFIKSRPELAKLSELKQGLALRQLTSEKYVGLPIMGYRIVPNHVGDIVNNYLSSTLYNSRIFGDAYKVWMGAANTLNQAQLGMGSAFHAGFTTGEVTVSAGANVLKDIYGVLRGNRSVRDLAESVGNSIIAAGRTQIVGDRVLNAWRNPDGGTMNPRIEQVTRAAELAGGAFKLEKGLQTEQQVKMMRDWFSGKRLKAAARSPLAFMEVLAKPIMDYLVPRQKAGVFADLAWRIIEMNPGKTMEELTPQFRQAWNRVDARLGQVVYDRLFMENWAKNTIQAMVRAPGWSGGTIAEIGGGFKDAAGFFVEWAKTGKLPENLPDRTAYVISLMAGVCAANAVLTYAFTGQMPTGMDYWAFRTGRKDEHGNDERFVLPTYAKDVLAYARNPLETLGHKTHPLVSLMADIFLKNKDYYGVEIRSRDASIPKQAGQAAAYVVKAFEPFWTRGARKEVQREAGFVRTTAPFFGVMPAPRSVTETKAENLAHDLMLEQIPSGARTKEQAARSQAKAKEKGPPTGTYLEHTAKRLNSMNALRVFEASTPKEQKLIGSMVWGKIWNSKSTSEEQKNEFVARFNKANGTGQTF